MKWMLPNPETEMCQVSSGRLARTPLVDSQIPDRVVFGSVQVLGVNAPDI